MAVTNETFSSPDSGETKKKLTSRQELVALLRRRFPGDEKQRTYLQLLLEGQAKAAIKGNTEAAKLLMRHAYLDEIKGRGGRKRKRKLRHL